jgi:hypothetical protein
MLDGGHAKLKMSAMPASQTRRRRQIAERLFQWRSSQLATETCGSSRAWVTLRGERSTKTRARCCTARRSKSFCTGSLTECRVCLRRAISTEEQVAPLRRARRTKENQMAQEHKQVAWAVEAVDGHMLMQRGSAELRYDQKGRLTMARDAPEEEMPDRVAVDWLVARLFPTKATSSCSWRQVLGALRVVA